MTQQNVCELTEFKFRKRHRVMQYKGAGDAAPNSTKWFFCFFASDCNLLSPDWPPNPSTNLSNIPLFEGNQMGQIWTVQFLALFPNTPDRSCYGSDSDRRSKLAQKLCFYLIKAAVRSLSLLLPRTVFIKTFFLCLFLTVIGTIIISVVGQPDNLSYFLDC